MTRRRFALYAVAPLALATSLALSICVFGSRTVQNPVSAATQQGTAVPSPSAGEGIRERGVDPQPWCVHTTDAPLLSSGAHLQTF